ISQPSAEQIAKHDGSLQQGHGDGRAKNKLTKRKRYERNRFTAVRPRGRQLTALLVTSTSRPDDAARRVSDNGADLRESGAEQEGKLSAARNGKDADPLRINFWLCAKPPECPFEIFQWNVVKPRRQRRRAEISERERSETVTSDKRRFADIN